MIPIIPYDDKVIHALLKLAQQQRSDVLHCYTIESNKRLCLICMKRFTYWEQMVEHGTMHYLKSRNLLPFL